MWWCLNMSTHLLPTTTAMVIPSSEILSLEDLFSEGLAFLEAASSSVDAASVTTGSSIGGEGLSDEALMDEASMAEEVSSAGEVLVADALFPAGEALAGAEVSVADVDSPAGMLLWAAAEGDTANPSVK